MFFKIKQPLFPQKHSMTVLPDFNFFMIESKKKLTGLPQLTIRPPSSFDGASVYRLITQSPPLDVNSLYCNLLQCTHFTDTSVIALHYEETMGFMSAYILPKDENTLFIWQVAVSKQARGLGLASAMLNSILDRPYCEKITHLETTITESNHASWALFKSLTKNRKAKLEKSTLFDRDAHLNGEYDTEYLVRISLYPASQIKYLESHYENF